MRHKIVNGGNDMKISFEEWRYSHEHGLPQIPGELLCDYEERMHDNYLEWLKGPGTTVVPLREVGNEKS